MRAEIIAIGDELIEGVRVDTNSAWLSTQLRMLGLDISYHTTVGDQLAELTGALQTAWSRADVVICTGGLGPTADDLTRQAVAEATGRPLETRADILEAIRQLFADRGRVMPPRNAVQAQFPAGSEVILNPGGTAPGFHLEITGAANNPVHLYALPGVPAEMRAMWRQTVEPALTALLGPRRKVFCQRRIHCFGMGESAVEQALPDLIRRDRQPLVGITAHQATITLRIVAQGATKQECQAAIEPVAAAIYHCLGNVIFGEGDDSLHGVVMRLLASRQQSLAIAEWGSCGLASHWIATTPEAATVLRGAVIAGQNETWSRIVPSSDQASTATDTRQLANRVAQTAEAVRRWWDADWGLAIGPFPESFSTNDRPQYVHIALASRAGTTNHPFRFGGHPEIIMPRFAKQALNTLRLALLGH